MFCLLQDVCREVESKLRLINADNWICIAGRKKQYGGWVHYKQDRYFRFTLCDYQFVVFVPFEADDGAIVEQTVVSQLQDEVARLRQNLKTKDEEHHKEMSAMMREFHRLEDLNSQLESQDCRRKGTSPETTCSKELQQARNEISRLNDNKNHLMFVSQNQSEKILDLESKNHECNRRTTELTFCCNKLDDCQRSARTKNTKQPCDPKPDVINSKCETSVNRLEEQLSQCLNSAERSSNNCQSDLVGLRNEISLLELQKDDLEQHVAVLQEDLKDCDNCRGQNSALQRGLTAVRGNWLKCRGKLEKSYERNSQLKALLPPGTPLPYVEEKEEVPSFPFPTSGGGNPPPIPPPPSRLIDIRGPPNRRPSPQSDSLQTLPRIKVPGQSTDSQSTPIHFPK